jgi:hypothetical protein
MREVTQSEMPRARARSRRNGRCTARSARAPRRRPPAPRLPTPPTHVPEAGCAFPRPLSASRCLEPRERPEKPSQRYNTPWTGGPCFVVRRARAPRPSRPSAGHSRGSQVTIKAPLPLRPGAQTPPTAGRAAASTPLAPVATSPGRGPAASRVVRPPPSPASTRASRPVSPLPRAAPRRSRQPRRPPPRATGAPLAGSPSAWSNPQIRA